MTKKLVIVGTGLFAEVASSYFQEFGNYDVAAFACHEAFKSSDRIYGHELLAIETLENVFKPKDVDVFVAIGYGKMNKTRQRVFSELKTKGYRCATYVHPSVHIWHSSTIGENVFIFEDNTIQPFTSIGNNTILWSGNHIGHHTKIGNHCFISSHVVISGSCHVGNNVFIGVNATLHDGLTIADETLVGAGAIISSDTNAKEVFVPSSTKVFHKDSEELGF